ncbi:MAG: dipeptide epimerase [Hyphomicrobium sp.]|jgi:L-alanine-DL-glutamate epimerase-like enolase superfamily enzyme|uniref:N-acetyl-D-Glu racemase DgcA n=1 Tax=Hyphomicrobium sp. TaxID=82 RepID=UPI0025C2D81B|nr:N-acetyl-D-Glu racemase DgcA [Hyphomicrobium sp.]MBX9861297.1 dipeptide epimerase [Hyphomicrobium sp.]
MTHLRLSVSVERFALKVPFVISRGTKTHAIVVAVSLSDGRVTGRGECTPYARYGETPESVVAEIEALAARGDVLGSRDAAGAREALAAALKPGAARNALDCALWDYEAKASGVSVAQRLGFDASMAVETCFTLSLGAPEAMAIAAREAKGHRLLKLKLGGAGDIERMAAVRHARPDARLVADANEAWTDDMVGPFLAAADESGFELVEQPLPVDADDILEGLMCSVPVCADESAHTTADVRGLIGRYEAVNIKLDKAGGLTEALAMSAAAKAAGFRVMIGSMVATSLAVAPAFALASDADWVDLDGPLLLAEDRNPPAQFADGLIRPPPSRLWG